MANYLATDTTLQNFRAQVLGQLGINSIKDAGITKPELDDILHSAISNFRSVAGSLVDGFYMTQDTTLVAAGTLVSNLVAVDISTLRVADISKCSLFVTSYGEIPIVSRRKFAAIRSLYSAAALTTTGAVASIFSGSSTSTATLTLDVYAGGTGALTGAVFVYPRNPIKQITDADKIDLPQTYVPLVRDIATTYLAKRLAKAIPGDVQTSVQNGVASLIAQLGLDMSPAPDQK
jgi:hypothetical protein